MTNSKLLIVGTVVGMVGLYLMFIDRPLTRTAGVVIAIIGGAIALKAHGR